MLALDRQDRRPLRAGLPGSRGPRRRRRDREPDHGALAEDLAEDHDPRIGTSPATGCGLDGNAGALLQRHHAVGGAAGECLAHAAGPLHLDPLVGGVVAQAEVQPGIVLREVAGAGLDLARQPPVADGRRTRAPRSRRGCRTDPPTQRTSSQFFCGPKFFSRLGRAPMLLTTTSSDPSLSRSPTAEPRDDHGSLKAGPGRCRDVLELAAADVPVTAAAAGGSRISGSARPPG